MAKRVKVWRQRWKLGVIPSRKRPCSGGEMLNSRWHRERVAGVRKKALQQSLGGPHGGVIHARTLHKLRLVPATAWHCGCALGGMGRWGKDFSSLLGTHVSTCRHVPPIWEGERRFLPHHIRSPEGLQRERAQISWRVPPLSLGLKGQNSRGNGWFALFRKLNFYRQTQANGQVRGITCRGTRKVLQWSSFTRITRIVLQLLRLGRLRWTWRGISKFKEEGQRPHIQTGRNLPLDWSCSSNPAIRLRETVIES